jgi:L-serine deaminase
MVAARRFRDKIEHGFVASRVSVDGNHRVSFDQVIETMWQTGADMQTKHKETSQGAWL